MRDGKVSSIRADHGFPGRLVTSLLQDHEGRLWLGVDGELTVYEEGRFHPVRQANGNPLGVVTAITEDAEHNIWVAVTTPRLFRIQDMQVREQNSPSRVPRVLGSGIGPERWHLAGLHNGNLGRYRRGQWKRLYQSWCKRKPGLECLG